MDLRKLKTLIDLVSESNVSELEITEAEGKVRIVKSGPTVVQQYVPAAAPAPAAAPSQPAAATRQRAEERGLAHSADVSLRLGEDP